MEDADEHQATKAELRALKSTVTKLQDWAVQQTDFRTHDTGKLGVFGRGFREIAPNRHASANFHIFPCFQT